MSPRQAAIWIAEHAEDYTDTLPPYLWVGGPGDPVNPLPGARSFFGPTPGLRRFKAWVWLMLWRRCR